MAVRKLWLLFLFCCHFQAILPGSNSNRLGPRSISQRPCADPVRASVSCRLTFMRLIVGLLMVLLSGCHGVSLFERSGENKPPSIMSLWERYQHCRTTTDPPELFRMIDLFEGVTLSGAEPPSWMKGWGDHVTRQPVRVAIDPHALGVACTLRAAEVMVAAARLTEARALYERVLTRYSSPAWAYYAGRAKEALLRLQDSSPATVAFIPDRLAPSLNLSCKKRTGRATYRQACEGTDEDVVLLQNPTNGPGPARDAFPRGLLVAKPASGVSPVAAASGICDGIEGTSAHCFAGEGRRGQCRALVVKEHSCGITSTTGSMNRDVFVEASGVGCHDAACAETFLIPLTRPSTAGPML